MANRPSGKADSWAINKDAEAGAGGDVCNEKESVAPRVEVHRGEVASQQQSGKPLLNQVASNSLTKPRDTLAPNQYDSASGKYHCTDCWEKSVQREIRNYLRRTRPDLERRA